MTDDNDDTAPAGAPSPYLLHEIMSGYLQSAAEEAAGLFLVYRRDEGDFTCHSFRLIRASSLRALNEYLMACALVLSIASGSPVPPVQLTIRLVHLRYPGQLWATEQYFGCRLEVAP